MTVSLSSGALFGVVSGASTSNTFSSVAGQVTTVRMMLTPGTPGASASLMRSTDGGATWAAVTRTSAAFVWSLAISGVSVSGTTATATVADTDGLTAGQSVTISGASVSAFNGTFTIAKIVNSTSFTFTVSGGLAAPSGSMTATFAPPSNQQMAKTYAVSDSTSTLYQVVTSASPGIVLFAADTALFANSVLNTALNGGWDLWYFGVQTVLTDLGAPVPPNWVGLTSDRLLSLWRIRSTPLSASDISGALTLYRRNANGSLAILSVPANVQRVFDTSYGPNRAIAVASATVTSLVDMQGNSVASDVSIVDPTFTYVPGSTVVARDLYGSGRAVCDPRGGPGIHGFTTKLEAAACGTLISSLASPNQSALGL